MVVGFLRKGKTYRAPCRWYPDGPIGTIEYYVAAPGAAYLTGDHIFFPVGFYDRTGDDADVGELTGEGHVRVIDGGIEPATEPGVGYTGLAADFRGETPYPGPAGEADCAPAPSDWFRLRLETGTAEMSIDPPEPPPTFDCLFLPGGVRSVWQVTLSGIVDGPLFDASVFNGTWNLDYVGSCVWQKVVATNRYLTLGRSSGWWNLAMSSESFTAVQWRNTASLDGSSPKVLTREAVPVWSGDNFGSPPIDTVTIT